MSNASPVPRLKRRPLFIVLSLALLVLVGFIVFLNWKGIVGNWELQHLRSNNPKRQAEAVKTLLELGEKAGPGYPLALAYNGSHTSRTAIYNLGPKGIRRILNEFSSDDCQFRGRLKSCLVAMYYSDQSTVIAPEIGWALSHPDRKYRLHIIELIEELLNWPPIPKHLIDIQPDISLLFSDPDFEVRVRAIKVVPYFGRHAPQFVPTLLPLHKDPDVEIRKGMIWAIAKTRPIDVRCFPVLRKLTNDTDDSVQKAARMALQELNP